MQLSNRGRGTTSLPRRPCCIGRLPAVDVFARTTGPARRAGIPALAAALAYAPASSLQQACNGCAGSETSEATPLLAYDVVVASVAVVLLVDLLFGRWTEATVADLVIGLGPRATGRIAVTSSPGRSATRRW